MTWYADSAIQLQNVVGQISTRLQNGGWTLYDNVAGAPVLSNTNNQGVPMYLQVSQSGSYTYIQLQAWRSWNAGTHVGSNGSNTSAGRMYFGGAARGATETCDLYMSVTSNRVIIFFYDQATNYRSWGYCGGLGSLAGTSDPGCWLILSSYEGISANNVNFGQMLQAVAGGSAFWSSCVWTWAGSFIVSSNSSYPGNTNTLSVQGIPSDGNKPFVFPIYCLDSFQYDTGFNAGVGPVAMRGDLDGLYICPFGNGGQNVATGSGMLSNLDTIVISGVTYLVVQPGGTPTINVHPFSGSYVQGLAIAEV